MSVHAEDICTNFPPSLIVGLRDQFGLEQAVETGTCSGGTTILLGLAFPKVTTVELSPNFYHKAAARLAPLEHVTAVFGNSPEWLAARDWCEEPPTLFYLDAHRSSEVGWRPPVDLPLHDELRAIGGLYGKHCIVIDDFFQREAVRSEIDRWTVAPFSFGQPPSEPGGYCFLVLTPRAYS